MEQVDGLPAQGTGQDPEGPDEPLGPRQTPRLDAPGQARGRPVEVEHPPLLGSLTDECLHERPCVPADSTSGLPRQARIDPNPHLVAVIVRFCEAPEDQSV